MTNPVRLSGFTSRVAAWFLAVMAVLGGAQAQPPAPAQNAEVYGYVRDPAGVPVANASVVLQRANPKETEPASTLMTVHTNPEGAYRFPALGEGNYLLRVEMKGRASALIGPVGIGSKETRKIDVVLIPIKPDRQAPQFFDEPQFTVAGVTQASNSGGHGSDTLVRTTETLAKATVSLSKEASNESGTGPEPPTAAVETSLRQALARDPNDAERHYQLADVEEKLGHPLEAVREYERAAQLTPSEPHLFEWGAELLTHRAFEPAAEVFSKGNRLFPKSVRMLVALGVVEYARGSYEQAAQYLAQASDLAPGDPIPYLFLGRMQSAEAAPLKVSTQRLERFALLQPDNPLANYYYAVSLAKESAVTADHDGGHSAQVESLLLKAVRLDPKLGAAHLQLGSLYAQRADFARAISAYQKAIVASSEESSLENEETVKESHYRLAQAYLRTGDKPKAQEQLQLYEQLAKKVKEDAEHERREIQEFVISLRGKTSDSPPQN
jgi:tetratricopeptide (TPR) repeat protein